MSDFGTLVGVDIKVEEKAKDLYLKASENFPWPSFCPAYATKGSAAVDLIAVEDYMIKPGMCAPVSTGICIDIREPGWAALVLPRSGLGARQGIVLGNSVGLIDNDYQGPVTCFLWNRGILEFNPTRVNQKEFFIKRGMRIAQMVFVPFGIASFTLVNEFQANTDRGVGGFGSTGN
jgi:dUTP pyrophosphatase